MGISAAAIRDALAKGDRRTIGEAGAVAGAVRDDQALLPSVISLLDDADPALVARSAHALMQISAAEPSLFDAYADDLLRHLAGDRQWEIGEQIPKILVRTKLSDSQLALLVCCLERNLNGSSAIAAACALHGIVDLAEDDRFDRARARQLLDDALRSDRKALAARARKLDGRV